MKKIKKTISMFSILLLIIICLTGCESKKNEILEYDKGKEFNVSKNEVVSNINDDIFIKVWEDDSTELQINKDGTFLIDHYTLSSQVCGSYRINGTKITFTNNNGTTWNGELVKQYGFYQLNIKYDNEDLVLYDLADKTNIKELYEYNDGTIYYTLCLYDNGTYKYEHSIHAAEGELGEYTIEGEKLTLKAHYSTGSDIGVSKKEKTMELIVNKDGSIADKNKLFSYTEDSGLDKKYKDFDFGNIVMKKVSNKQKEEYKKAYPSIQTILSRSIIE